jgi:hypothetical protein
MVIEYQGKLYTTLRASDLVRDGMALEFSSGSETVAEIFYSDVSGEFTISVFTQDLPLPVIEQFIAEGRGLLPPAPENS